MCGIFIRRLRRDWSPSPAEECNKAGGRMQEVGGGKMRRLLTAVLLASAVSLGSWAQESKPQPETKPAPDVKPEPKPSQETKPVPEMHVQAGEAMVPKQVPEAKPEDVDTIDHVMAATYDVISGPAGERDWNRFRSLFYKDA